MGNRRPLICGGEVLGTKVSSSFVDYIEYTSAITQLKHTEIS